MSSATGGALGAVPPTIAPPAVRAANLTLLTTVVNHAESMNRRQ